MPEIAEIRWMSDFINQISEKNSYVSCNIAENCKVKTDMSLFPGLFNLKAKSRGKELMLEVPQIPQLKLMFSMGMSGTWAFISRNSPSENKEDLMKHARLWFDTPSGGHLILHDARRFAKWSWKKNWSANRGPDPIDEYDEFINNIYSGYNSKAFSTYTVASMMLSQKYFSGIGNYLRSTILYHADVNPFQTMDSLLEHSLHFRFLELCKSIPIIMYQKNGGQIKNWKNPFGYDPDRIEDIIFYQEGYSCKDESGRTFWFDPKWEKFCPFEIEKYENEN
jgi:formamidopyrimidine-DNA glycosylase